MPKPFSSRKRPAEEDYDSDDGFVEKEDGKTSKLKKVKSSSFGNGSGALVDDDGNEYWEISAKRRVQVSQFGKGTFVNIREFYESNGKTLPGKKGIALNIEQFNALVELLPQIEKALQPKAGDLKISRPRYDDNASAATGEAEKSSKDPIDDEHEDEAEDDKKKDHNDRPQKRQKQKANHEATSSEDEG